MRSVPSFSRLHDSFYLCYGYILVKIEEELSWILKFFILRNF